MFGPDRPIDSEIHDILHRSGFAKSVGESILRYEHKDSIVIAMFGAWGCGKTSIINMAMEHIEKETKGSQVGKPIIIWFNPWNFSDQEQLTTQFFRQFSHTLKRADNSKGLKKAGEALETYSRFFQPLRLIPVAGQYADLAKEGIEAVGKGLKVWGDFKGKDLEAIRAELNSLLERQKSKIIVIIDDIDRLNDTEIRQLFQVVKSLADFPNTIYILAFDKDVIVKALSKVQAASGTEYLGKIVQVPLEVPAAPREEVERFLFQKLDEVVGSVPDDKWDPVYWGNIFQSGLRLFFGNIRDVNRYMNLLRFGFSLVRDEVNPIDFIAITAIQVFIPDLYQGIRNNKSLFAGPVHSALGTDLEKGNMKKRCDALLEQIEKYPREDVKDFLRRLFPNLNSLYGNIGYGSGFAQEWRKAGRICSPDVFDKYFMLSVPSGDLSEQEIRSIIQASGDATALEAAFLKVSEGGKIDRLLERIEDFTEKEIPEENIETVVTVLMDIGDLFPEKEEGFYGIRTSMRVCRLFYQLIHRFQSQEQRYHVLRNAIRKANRSLYIVVDEVGLQGDHHGKYGSNRERSQEEKTIISDEQLDQLEKLACQKISKWAKEGRLLGQKHLVSILYMWKRWGQDKDLGRFIRVATKGDENLVAFITAFLNKTKSHGMEDYVYRVNWRIELKNIKDFIEISKIEPRLRKMPATSFFAGLDQEKQMAVKVFLDTVDGKIEDV